MLKIFDDIRDVTKKLDNIDATLTITVAFLAIVLKTFGFLPDKFDVNYIILTILFFLSVSSLVNRARLDGGTTPGLENSGLIGFRFCREKSNLIKITKDSKKKLDYIGTSLPDMSSDQGYMALRDKVKESKVIEVRILLLNPNSVMALKKNELYCYRRGWRKVSENIKTAIRAFKDIREELEPDDKTIKNRFDVRVYSTIPATSCVFNDNRLNITFYDENKPGSMAPAWELEKNDKHDGLYNYYQAHFEKIWKEAISVFDKDFEKKSEGVLRKELNILKGN